MHGRVPAPRSGFVAELERLKRDGDRRWRSEDGRLYEWDELHGEWEVYNSQGYHLGAADGMTGRMIKPARKDRRIDV